MGDLSSPKFDVVRNYIKKRREESWDWDKIKALDNPEDPQAEIVQIIRYAAWPTLSYEEYCEIVRLQKEAEEDNIRLVEQSGMATIFDGNQNNDAKVPTDERSCWQCYKRGLLEEGWTEQSLQEIELATIRILKNLTDSQALSPVKGMVIGNVQSGKTANMAALMAMAADWGWNMFIILAGTIDNLRKQTADRLYRDLYGNLTKRPTLMWRLYHNLSRKSPQGQKAQDLSFNPNYNDRHFTVSLKNAKRLEGLIDWLHADANSMRQMKVLVIDDEADQASVNTAVLDTKERKKINRLICNLVNGRDKKYTEDETLTPFAAMNYIGYTATPYANVLNEYSDYSLYPRNFISCLGVSKEYFGPQQIFGTNEDGYDGLDIVRKVETEEVETIKSIHKGDDAEMPSSLSSAICWFLCGVSCMRFWGYNKPISMLVHTSQKTDHHDSINKLISGWLSSSSRDSLVKQCQVVSVCF